MARAAAMAFGGCFSLVREAAMAFGGCFSLVREAAMALGGCFSLVREAAMASEDSEGGCHSLGDPKLLFLMNLKAAATALAC